MSLNGRNVSVYSKGKRFVNPDSVALHEYNRRQVGSNNRDDNVPKILVQHRRDCFVPVFMGRRERLNECARRCIFHESIIRNASSAIRAKNSANREQRIFITADYGGCYRRPVLFSGIIRHSE
ncbi:hypothetical protein Trydic_g1553 [Trypoxylus dichotomus]